MMDEGKLTLIKGKLISNRNLYYCGKGRNLGGKMKVHPFAPQSDWTPPGFAVPPFLKEKLNSHGGITKNILFQLTIPECERRSGQLSRETMVDIVESLNESKNNNTIGSTSTTLEALLGTQSVPDKSVADCVEAMIGAWLISGGGAAALRLLGWFGVFPHGRHGPAGSWEELVGEEALDMGKRGMIKDQSEFDIIGGVVDWGPKAEQNTSEILAQVSEKLEKTDIFRPKVENDTAIEKGRQGDVTAEGMICDSKPIKKSYDESVEIEQNSITLTKYCHTGMAFKNLVDSEDESMDNDDELSHESNLITDGSSNSTADFLCSPLHDECDFDEDQESDLSHENDFNTDGNDSNSSDIPCSPFHDECDFDEDQESHTSDNAESFDEIFDDILMEDNDVDSNSTTSNRMNEIDFLDDEIYESLDDQMSENSAVTEDDCYVSLDSSKKIMENPLCEENNMVYSIKLESCPTAPKREKLCLGEVKSLSSNEFNNIGKKHEMGTTSDTVKRYFIHANRNITRCKQRPLLFSDFEVNGHDRRETTVEESIESMLIGADKLENCINYKFKNRSLLLQALTHASYYPNRITECYQRLEFLGDAVLDFVITCHIYETGGKLNPGQLTDLRSALVNNITFASLVVRYGLHRHLLHLSPSLMEAIDSFVDFQLQRDNAVTEDCLVLMEEDECYLAESVEVPKALGDILESLAGAIFLDSGLSLTAVWQVFYPMMKNEIQAFMKNIPKQPVRELLETTANIHFMPSEEVKPAVVGDEVQRSGLSKQIVMVPVKVTDVASGQERIFYGFGERKSLAKRAAAKLALRAMGKGTKPQYFEKDREISNSTTTANC